MATFCREFFCASNETFREKFRSVLKDYIGAKVIKEMKQFFILPEIILLPRGTVCRAAVDLSPCRPAKTVCSDFSCLKPLS